MLHWEPEGAYFCTKSMAIVPFWFSMEHCWTTLAPFWLLADDIMCKDVALNSCGWSEMYDFTHKLALLINIKLILIIFFYSLVDYATGNVCANFHGDCAIDGRDLRGGLIQPPPPATEQPKKPGLVRVKWKFCLAIDTVQKNSVYKRHTNYESGYFQRVTWSVSHCDIACTLRDWMIHVRCRTSWPHIAYVLCRECLLRAAMTALRLRIGQSTSQ